MPARARLLQAPISLPMERGTIAGVDIPMLEVLAVADRPPIVLHTTTLLEGCTYFLTHHIPKKMMCDLPPRAGRAAVGTGSR